MGLPMLSQVAFLRKTSAALLALEGTKLSVRHEVTQEVVPSRKHLVFVSAVLVNALENSINSQGPEILEGVDLEFDTADLQAFRLFASRCILHLHFNKVISREMFKFSAVWN